MPRRKVDQPLDILIRHVEIAGPHRDLARRVRQTNHKETT
jgi:hypothetical protein